MWIIAILYLVVFGALIRFRFCSARQNSRTEKEKRILRWSFGLLIFANTVVALMGTYYYFIHPRPFKDSNFLESDDLIFTGFFNSVFINILSIYWRISILSNLVDEDEPERLRGIKNYLCCGCFRPQVVILFLIFSVTIDLS